MAKVTKANPNAPQRQKLPLTSKRNPPTVKQRYVCAGGPYNGVTLYLSTPYTIVFSAKGLKGRYISKFKHELIWEEIK